MGRSGILILIFVLGVSSVRAQQAYSFRQADSSTYAAYQAGDWDEVIDKGKLALDQGIDYFYLRLRMGISYFSKQNYRLASKHLSAAEAFNPESGISKEYQYYSFLYAGRYAEAAYTAGSLNERMREVSGIEKHKVFTGVHLETGPEFSNNIDENTFGQMPQGQVWRWQDLYGNSFYGHLGFILQLHPRLNIYAAYSYLGIDKQAELQYLWNEPDSIVEYGWGFRKLFPSEPKVENQQYNYNLQQHDIYLKAGIYMGKGWTLSPAFHYVNVHTESISINNSSSLVQDTAYYNETLDSVAYIAYDRLQFDIDATPLILNNVVVSLGLNKQISIFDLGAFGSWSNLNNMKQVQFGLSAAYYPLGNTNLYGKTIVKGLSEEEELRLVFSQSIGFRAVSFLWAEAYGVFGNMRGTNESDAYVVYNISDDINLKTGLSLTFVISPSVHLSARYQYLMKTGYRYVNGPQVRPGNMIQETDYSNHSIIGGLKWIF